MTSNKRHKKLNEIARQAGLRINEEKTKVMRINTGVREAVKIDEKDVEYVEIFTYLGGVITTKGGADEDINNILGKAKSQFGRLRKIWSLTKFSIQTKII